MTARQYFRAPNGRFASPARFEWQLRAETGAYRPFLRPTASRPDIPTLTDEYDLGALAESLRPRPLPWWWYAWAFLTGQRWPL